MAEPVEARSDSRTVILGTAMGYSADDLRPFVRSLSRSGYDGDVVLVADQAVASAIHDDPDFAGVDAMVAPFWFPMKRRLLNRPRRMRLARLALLPRWALMRVLARFQTTKDLARSCALRAVPPTESRFIHYLRILRDSQYERVILTDVRDVVFQADPFQVLTGDSLAVGMETDRYRIGDERWNSWFVERAYGPAMLDRLRDCPVSCSGVTYGSTAAMMPYLDLMADEVVRLRFVATLQPLDQGLHNKLLWTGAIDDFERLELFDSALATLHPDDEDRIELDEDGFVVNRDGSRIAILHQYDRLPNIRQHLLGRLTT